MGGATNFAWPPFFLPTLGPGLEERFLISARASDPGAKCVARLASLVLPNAFIKKLDEAFLQLHILNSFDPQFLHNFINYRAWFNAVVIGQNHGRSIRDRGSSDRCLCCRLRRQIPEQSLSETKVSLQCGFQAGGIIITIR